MTGWVAAFVVSGVLAAILLGLGSGFDGTAFVYLAAIAVVGVLAVRIAARFSRGTIQAGFCPHCGGTVSPNAPYCKHCLEPTEHQG
ncbi:MAG: hypothetical protein ACR2KQ_02765 [Actinomycetota bacterium]